MKCKYSSLLFAVLAILWFNNLQAQEASEEFEPMYVTISTLQSVENVNFKKWNEVEREYFDKITKNNDLIISQEVLMDYFSPNFSEVKVITFFKSWEDIETSGKVTDDLIAQHWPNEAERKAFFELQNSFYTNFHSDKIYLSSQFIKTLSTELKSKTEPRVFFSQKTILADNDDEEVYIKYKQFMENVIYKNPFILAYQPFRYYWGGDSREFIEFFVIDSLADLENSVNTNKYLLEAYLPDDAKREEFIDVFRKSISSQSSTIYKNIPSLSK